MKSFVKISRTISREKNDKYLSATREENTACLKILAERNSLFAVSISWLYSVLPSAAFQ